MISGRPAPPRKTPRLAADLLPHKIIAEEKEFPSLILALLLLLLLLRSREVPS